MRSDFFLLDAKPYACYIIEFLGFLVFQSTVTLSLAGSYGCLQIRLILWRFVFNFVKVRLKAFCRASLTSLLSQDHSEVSRMSQLCLGVSPLRLVWIRMCPRPEWARGVTRLRCVCPGLMELHTALVGVSRESLCRFWNPLSLELPPVWYSASHEPTASHVPTTSASLNSSLRRLTCAAPFPCAQVPLLVPWCGELPHAGGQGSGLTHSSVYLPSEMTVSAAGFSPSENSSFVCFIQLSCHVRQESKLSRGHSIRARGKSLSYAFHRVKRIKLVLPRKSERRIKGDDPFPMW